MKQSLDAIYEHGVFKPLQRPEIPDGQYVRLVVEPFSEPPVEEILALAAQVYDDLSPEQIDDIEKIVFNRHDFFYAPPLTVFGAIS